MALFAINAYLKSIRDNLRANIHGKFDAAVRTLDLAIMIGDETRIDAARSTLLDVHRQALVAGDGMWWIAFDRLIEEKRTGVSDEGRDELVSDLEGFVAKMVGSSIAICEGSRTKNGEILKV
jgi:hypothetical protein